MFALTVCISAVMTGVVLSQQLNCKVPADIVILMDGSASIRPEQWKQQTDFVRNIIENFDIGPELIRIGLVVFSSFVGDTVGLQPFNDKQALRSKNFEHPRGGTNTGSGIARVRKMFREEGRPNTPHIMVVITDGKSMKPTRTIDEARQARLSGIIVFVVAVGQDVFMHELKQIVSAADTLIDIKNFGSLQHTVQRLKASVCKVIPPITTTTPVPTTQPPSSSPGPADVILLLGGCSECTTELDWQALLRFVTTFVNNIDVSYPTIHIGVIVFSSGIDNIIQLSPFKGKMTLIQMVNRLQRPRYGSGENVAIDKMIQMFEQQGRPGVAKTGVFISLGRAKHYSSSMMQRYSNSVYGIRLISFGIDRPYIDFSYVPIQIIPIQQHYSTSDEGLSWTLIYNIYRGIRDYKPMSTTTTKRPTTTTTVSTERSTTTTTPASTTDPGSVNCQVPADIVILIDGSDSITDEDWQEGISFVTQLIDHLDIAFDGNHIGEIVYSSSIGDVIKLSPYKGKPVLKHLTKGLRHPKDGTNTAVGIERTRQMIREEGRSNAPHIAIVITDGRSKDRKLTIAQASLAKQEGITMVTVGVGAFDIADELTQIATRPSLYYPVGNYQALVGLIKTLKAMVCQVVTTPKPTHPIITTTPTGPVPPSLCDGCIIDRGIGYNPYPEDCTKYVQCFREGLQFRAVIRPCPFGSFWDTSVITCRESTTVSCPKGPCTGMTDGSLVPYAGMGCKAHWACYGGKAMARCCPLGQSFRAGWGCTPNTLCNDLCPPESQSDATVKCDLRRHPTDESKYIQITPGGDLVRPCAPGSVFMEEVCTCLMKQGPLPPPRECLPSVNYTFNGNLEDTSRDKSYSGMRNLALTNHGTAMFTGDSSINMWRFAGIDFGSDFVVKLRYKLGLPLYGATQSQTFTAGSPSRSAGIGNLQGPSQTRMSGDSLLSGKPATAGLNILKQQGAVPFGTRSGSRSSVSTRVNLGGAAGMSGMSGGTFAPRSGSRSSISTTVNMGGAGGMRGMNGGTHASGGRISKASTASGSTVFGSGLTGSRYQLPGAIRLDSSSFGGRFNFTRVNTTFGSRSGGSGTGTRTVTRQMTHGSGNPQIAGGVRGVQLGGSSFTGGSWNRPAGPVVYGNRSVTRTVRMGPKVVSRHTYIGNPPVTFRQKRTKRQTMYPQALITNCDGVDGQGPSILILVSPNEVTFKLKTSSTRTQAAVTLPATNGFNDVTMKYDGYILTASVNGQEASTRITGAIERRQAGLLVGACDGFSNFRGEIDYVHVWQCLP